MDFRDVGAMLSNIAIKELHEFLLTGDITGISIAKQADLCISYSTEYTDRGMIEVQALCMDEAWGEMWLI